MASSNRKDDSQSKDEERWGQSRAELEKRTLALRKDGMGVLKIGRTLRVGTSLVQRVVG